MFSKYTLCGIVSLSAIAGCQSSPDSKPDAPKKDQSVQTYCILQSHVIEYWNILERCGLSMRAKVPVVIKSHREIKLQIPKGKRWYNLSCAPSSPWVRHLNETLIAACNHSRLHLYWVGPLNTSYFRIDVILDDGDKHREYTIKNGNTLDAFWDKDWGPGLLFVPQFDEVFVEPTPFDSEAVIEETINDAK